MTIDELRDWLVAAVAEIVQVEGEAIDTHEPFDAYGLSSRDAVALSGDLEQLLGRELSPTLAYEYPSIEALARYLIGAPSAASAPQTAICSSDDQQPIAIIGMGCRFPGADDPAAFWGLLRNGEDRIGEVPADRWKASDYYDPDPSQPGKAVTRWGGFLDRIDRFDPFFFGISPGEAEGMDPQQRLLLELAYEAFEDAGYTMPRLAGSRTAVMIGISINEYASLQFGRHELITGHSATGAALSIAANRISYFFDLHGPSMALDTACSSSLAAVHLACASLRGKECNLAIAGGVNLILSPAHSIAFTKAGVLAPDGRCKPFDAGADGYVRGEGGGLVVLKRLDQAIADGDAIHAIIRGSAVLQDGRTNGLIAPNGEAQKAVLETAYRNAGVRPGQVQYVEAHGTGTLLGDSMEARALGAVLSGGRTTACLLGSVKSNFGHLEAAAGVAGLIKVVIALKQRVIPPSLHFKEPNPQVPFEELGLRVAQTLEPWPDHDGPALAGVSSFGFGGTNVHLVVEEAPGETRMGGAPAGRAESDIARMFPIAARSLNALMALAGRYREHLSADPTLSIDDLCYTAGTRRNHFGHRTVVVAESSAELAERLDGFLRGEPHPDVAAPGLAPAEKARVVFVFSGQGGQWTGMGRELFRDEPVFRAAMERCEVALRPHLVEPLLPRLLEDGIADEEIDLIQPALFAVQVALTALWRSWGIEPDAVVGHSMGEVAAAHAAGALGLDDAARVICERSRLLKRLVGMGGMVMVGLSSEETAPLLAAHGPQLSIAACNGPRSTVVAGESVALAYFIDILEGKDILCRPVKVDVPAHGPEAAPLAEELRTGLEGLKPRPFAVPFFSSVAGTVDEHLALDADYWAKNLSEPVNFAGAMRDLIDAGHEAFVEISPHPILRGAIQQGMLALGRVGKVLASLHREEPERRSLLRSLAELYVSGWSPEWARVSPGGRPVALPAYPWQRERFWLDFAAEDADSSRRDPAAKNEHPFLRSRMVVAREPSSTLWQSELDSRSTAFLASHRVNGEIIVPAAAFLETAFSAAAAAGMADHCTVNDLALPSSLALSGRRRIAQTALAPLADAALAFSVHSRDRESDSGAWTLHATATLAREAPSNWPDQSGTPIALIKERLLTKLCPDALYRGLAERGLDYGPALRAIVEVWGGEGEALARILPSDALAAEAASYRIHPALIDAALQTIAAAVPAHVDAGATFVPVGCRTARLLGRPDAHLWSHVVLRPGTGLGASGLEADVRLLDNDGRLIVELAGCRLARLEPSRAPAADPVDGTWLYDVRWQPANWPEPDRRDDLEARGSGWIILADRHGVAEALERHLQVEGQSCRIIGPELIAGDSLCNALAALLASRSPPPRGIIHIADGIPGCDVSKSEDPAPTLPMLECARVLGLVQAMIAAGPALGTPRLWLVTRGAQPVLAGEPVALHQAPLWGLGKSIAFELPEFSCSLVDLDPKLDLVATSALLARQLLNSDQEDQVALRGEGRLVARLHARPSLNGAPAGIGAPAGLFRADATYLISGGLGGLGLTVAQWMIEQGARQLVLMGRTGGSPAANAAVATMSRNGARVVAEAADVTDASVLAAVLESIRSRMPPLRGVIHAAGVLDNSPIAALDRERLVRVMAPKVAGAWNLHSATLEDALDHFVLFSSAVSVLGSPGQGNYAAGNSFLDALSHHRRALGLPGLSINWGPWAGVGLVAEANHIGSRGGLGDAGVKGIEPRRGLELLARAIADGTPQLTVLPFDLATLLDLYPAAAKIPLFAEVGGRATHVAQLYSRPSLREDYLAPRNDIERRLAELWRQALRIDRVGVRDSFFELGGDSVLAAQIMIKIERAFGVSVDVREVFQLFTVESLASRVEAELVARLEQLSESDVQRLLQQ